MGILYRYRFVTTKKPSPDARRLIGMLLSRGTCHAQPICQHAQPICQHAQLMRLYGRGASLTLTVLICGDEFYKCLPVTYV
jgi:hypothetical protein